MVPLGIGRDSHNGDPIGECVDKQRRYASSIIDT